MIYSEVIARNLILPRKNKYTVADVNKLLVASLFFPTGTLRVSEAVFIVKCSAIFHGVDYSKDLFKKSVSVGQLKLIRSNLK
jgi:hypothetical protein